MPIPFNASHSTIASSPPNATTVSTSTSHNNSNNNTSNNSNNSDSSPTVGRLGLSTYGRTQTQSLDSRRWSRFQRRSPLDSHPAAHHSHHHHSHLSHNHHSPRTRYFASFASITQPQSSNPPSRVLLSPPPPHASSSSTQQQHQLDSLPFQQQFSPSSPLHARDHGQQQHHQQTPMPQRQGQQQYSSQGDTATPFTPFSSSLPPNAHPTAVSNLFPDQNLLLPMESSRPSESFNSSLATGASATASLSASFNQNDNAAHRGSDQRARALHPALLSTPMQRSLTNNPAMTPSYSSIHAASMDPSSVPVSASVSTSLPTPATSSSGAQSDNNNNNNSRSNGDNNNLNNSATASSRTNRSNSSDGVVAGSSSNFNSSDLDESRHQYRLAQPTTTTLPSPSSTNNHNSNSNTSQSARSEVDDRIHFRLLDGIYFSAPPRPLRHDDDLGMDSPPQPQTRSELQYIDIQDTNSSDQEDEYMHDNNAMEDLDFGESRQRHSMYNGQGDEFASVTFHRRSSHPELIEEEEEDEEPHQLNRRHHNILQVADDDDDDDDGIDDDNGIDEVMEGHHHSAALVRSPSSSLPSHLERPQHAQFLPHSAAALTSIFTMGRPSWPQPLISSSITSDLITISQPGARSEYDNNPYYRRPGTSFHGQTDHGRRMDTSSSSHSYLNSMPNHPMWQSSSSVPGNMLIPRSIPIQHNEFDRLTSSSHHQYGRRPSTEARGCGEVNYAPSLEARGDVWPLNFDMYYADGGEFNAAHSIENVLKNDSSVYWYVHLMLRACLGFCNAPLRSNKFHHLANINNFFFRLFTY